MDLFQTRINLECAITCDDQQTAPNWPYTRHKIHAQLLRTPCQQHSCPTQTSSNCPRSAIYRTPFFVKCSATVTRDGL